MMCRRAPRHSVQPWRFRARLGRDIAGTPPPIPDARPVGVLVVDDQTVFHQAAQAVIEATDEFALVGAASSGAQALEAADRLDPDLVLLDVRMPGMDGFETATRLRSAHPQAVIVLVSADQSPHPPSGTNSSSAAALVPKQAFGSAMLRRLWRDHGHPLSAGGGPGAP
jgi:CheY-like chemotaxis protein